MDLAKALLYLALYMQQLPPDFDAQSLQTPDVETTIQCYVSTVNSLVLVQEEMVCSSDGLECLHMLGMIYINEGAFRKAWLSFRRALDVAKIKGFRNSYASSSRQGPSYKLAAQRRLWLDTIAGDCYLSLLLGLEPVLGSEPFGRNGDADDQHGNVDAKFEREFYPIVARLAKNRFLDQHDYEPAREIDRLLDELWDSMPGAWQRTPTLRLGRSFESAKDYSRLMCHLHFFLIRIFIHLPFAFSDGTGDQEYSKDRCLEASRIILHWYFGLQKDGKGQPRCKIIDITAFLAAVTILLTEAGHGAATSRKQAYSSDRALLDQFMHSQEALGLSCEREHIAKQSATAFDTHNKAARVFDLAFSNER
ncbi:hypothetical protein N0V88_007469 [Collariella sp. IMI 366227]|nr:hypothetical protein N0V88_007469 [Collariella sp. IMI 366227]